ncbi:MAG: Asp-tRNA(Asn)/Glu-tRNA(Gln) amidotransferase subunit GatC [Candidatus Peribacter sp.]|jgi:aspartyl-tRNA(Asn)/glutamyl-tRNA(Gln) amidotransferase subunit C|nr:Asp-tRNA(Asn)/Glu-tRNA(Gln) amidotransferase subunit GatC [Candidatus Peribacter sp.]MBT4393478.1 Asp-tRNA(Asn)/Glu-tRNA(Gln) amidotransferase subunit GatC [Candidatus Peribacter sp.]MBT4600837.1 Asp-tRNA(Asn)/Glu-tRNA(Gln) amidotransferase subunit GatC [Candidatus Peribacter sp.]MBT5149484.1 Asp-tRNA(Asn)/Glu-tRNA(Gln) amidotransferase subunit GatC [Candidatus Peribacter sp.]MBT5637317.1 Asp-tRNA(Asn)/Glu-tRNA(Gln) amidotransferase subunit GatC [Candidatus Peribacter sp.]
MATLSNDDVRHIGKLCRLNLSDEEVKRLGPELSSILSFVDKLQEVDTSSVEPTPQPTGITNGFREDEVVADGPTREELLATSPLPIVDNQIQTPSAHG